MSSRPVRAACPSAVVPKRLLASIEAPAASMRLYDRQATFAHRREQRDIGLELAIRPFLFQAPLKCTARIRFGGS